MATLPKAPTTDFSSTTLNGSIDDSTTTVTVNNGAAIQTPTYIVVDREDANGTETPNSREVMYVSSKSSNDLTVTRGVNNSTARSHNSGAVVEPMLTVGLWADLYTVVDEEHDTDGTHDTSKVSMLAENQTVSGTRIYSGNVTIAGDLSGANVFMSAASISGGLDIDGELTADTAVFSSTVTIAGMTAIGPYFQAPQVYSPASGATVTIDLSAGNEHRIHPVSNFGMVVSNETNGQKFLVSILQDGTGSRTATWFETIRWAGGTAPTLTTTASKRDTLGFIVTGTDTYDGFVVGQNI